MASVPVFADGSSPSEEPAEVASLSGGALGELLDWLLGLVDAPESGDGNDGEGNPTADPSG